MLVEKQTGGVSPTTLMGETDDIMRLLPLIGLHLEESGQLVPDAGLFCPRGPTVTSRSQTRS